MKLKTLDSVFILAVIFTLFTASSANAQEEKALFDSENVTKEIPKNEQDPSPGGESPDLRSTKNTNPPPQQETVSRDAEQKNVKPAAKAVEKPVKEEEKAQKEEDPISFNFLYYIIEKFKLSDIIE